MTECKQCERCERGTYEIRRFYFESGKKSRRIKTVSCKRAAMEHCSDPSTSRTHPDGTPDYFDGWHKLD